MSAGNVVSIPPPAAGEARFRVLVVDDEGAFRTALGRRLREMGFEAETVASGEEAISTSRKAASEGPSFDAVLLDLWMPDRNGIETLEELKKIDPNLSVVAISGMGTPASEEAVRRAGGEGLLPKPIDGEDLQDQVQRAAEKTGRLRAKAEAGETPPRNGRILLADDHPSFRRAVARRLRLYGFGVTEAETGREAVAAWEKGKFDAALLDVHMPDGDGVSAARGIRLLDPQASILYLSGEATRGEIREGTRFSSGGCLRKPVDLESLGRTVFYLVEAARAARQEALLAEARKRLSPLTRAGLRLRHAFRALRRSGELKRAALAVLLTVLVSLPLIMAADRAQRAAAEAHASVENLPTIGEIYREVSGYLHRDEAREIERAER